MGRRPRVEYEGAIYHVIQRGNNREHIFANYGCKQFILELIEKSVKVDQVDLFAFVIMNNHYHLALRTGEEPISKIMHRMNSNYGRFYNREMGRSGPVFEGRYKALPIENENYLLTVIRYIHRNPVHAGLCNTIDEYNWSSDRAYQGKQYNFVTTSVLLSILGASPTHANNEYQRLMAIEDDYTEDKLRYVGTESFWSAHNPISTMLLQPKPDLDSLLLDSGASPGEIKLIKAGNRRHSLTKFKYFFVHRAIDLGYSMEEIGKHISVSGVAVGKILNKLES